MGSLGGDGAVRDVEASLATWRSRVRDVFTELSIDPLVPDGFSGDLRHHTRGGLRVAEIHGAHQTVDRADAGIRRAPVDDLYFILQRSGRSLFQAGGDGDRLSLGDSVLYDMNSAHTLHFDCKFEQLCVLIPNAMVKEGLGRAVDAQLGRRFIGSDGLGRVVGAAALALVDYGVDQGQETLLGEVFIDMLARSIASRAAGQSPSPTGPAARWEALRRFIGEHHDREGLSPSDAASALGCSLRQIHSIAAAQGASFGRLLMEARLRSAHLLLVRGARVSEAAFASGFSDLSHFSRSFKTRYGTAPRLLASQG